MTTKEVQRIGEAIVVEAVVDGNWLLLADRGARAYRGRDRLVVRVGGVAYKLDLRDTGATNRYEARRWDECDPSIVPVHSMWTVVDQWGRPVDILAVEWIEDDGSEAENYGAAMAETGDLNPDNVRVCKGRAYAIDVAGL